MKKIIILSAIVLSLITKFSYSENNIISNYLDNSTTFTTNDTTELKYKNGLNFSILHFLNNSIHIGYHRNLTKNLGLVLIFGYQEKNGNIDASYMDFRAVKYNIKTAEIRLNNYILKSKNKNKYTENYFYFSPYAYIDLVTVKKEVGSGYIYRSGYKDFNESALAYGLVMGIYSVYYKRLTFDTYVGGGIRSYSEKTTNNNNNNNDMWKYNYTGIESRIGLRIGFTF